ncbi:MAG: hypothetical protein MRZ36_05740 [Eubacterium sp.]|nr:hypothetical protein [Eubacterium sp.]
MIGTVAGGLVGALPFLIFRGKRKMLEFLIRLNEVLPAGIMAVTYKWKHNTLFSIVAGTALYMVLLQML